MRFLMSQDVDICLRIESTSQYLRRGHTDLTRFRYESSRSTTSLPSGSDRSVLSDGGASKEKHFENGGDVFRSSSERANRFPLQLNCCYSWTRGAPETIKGIDKKQLMCWNKMSNLSSSFGIEKLLSFFCAPCNAPTVRSFVRNPLSFEAPLTARCTTKSLPTSWRLISSSQQWKKVATGCGDSTKTKAWKRQLSMK